jgi:hypothetical protein
MAGLIARQIYTPQAIDIRMTKRMLTIANVGFKAAPE